MVNKGVQTMAGGNLNGMTMVRGNWARVWFNFVMVGGEAVLWLMMMMMMMKEYAGLFNSTIN